VIKRLHGLFVLALLLVATWDAKLTGQLSSSSGGFSPTALLVLVRDRWGSPFAQINDLS
jgi:hypothetical protein